MAAIPIYQQQTSVGGGFQGAQADPAAFGAGVATSLEGFAQGAHGLAMADLYDRKHAAHELKIQEEKDAKSWAGTAVSQASLDWTKNLNDRKAAALPGAPDFTPGILADFDSYASKLRENAPTPMAKDFLNQHLTQMRTSIGEHALGFEAGARINLRTDNAQTTINNAGSTVLQDPSQYSAQLNLIRQTMPEVGPEMVKKLNDHAIASLTEAAAAHTMDAPPTMGADGKLRGGPYDMRDLTSKALGENGFTGKTGVPWIDDATPQQIKAWNTHAVTKIHMMDSEAARYAEARAKAAETVFGEATDLTSKGQYMSDGYRASLISSTQGTPWEAAAVALVNSQATTAGFASAPAGDRNAVLNQLRTAGATPGQGTDAQSAKQLAKIETIHSEIGKAVEQNPWVAAQKYGVARDSSLIPITSVGDAVKAIQTRAQTQGQVETWAGHAINPLQPDETAQLGNVLAAMPPPAKSQALAQIGAMLPLGRLSALADDLDKKDKPLALSLKLGFDQTNAGRQVSELVLQGAQGLKDKTIKRDDQALSGWRSNIAGLVRGTMGPDGQKIEDDIIEASYYVRAAMDSGTINLPGYHLGSSEADAIKLVIGQPMERNGVKTLLPRGMDEGAFDKALGAYTADVFKTLAPGGYFVRGQPVTAERVAGSITNYGMRRDGSGNYLPVSGGAFITLDKEGQKPLRLPIIR